MDSLFWSLQRGADRASRSKAQGETSNMPQNPRGNLHVAFEQWVITYNQEADSRKPDLNNDVGQSISQHSLL